MNEHSSLIKVADMLEVPGASHNLYAAIVAKINDWLNHDFHRLIVVLYRMDVNEDKLKTLLKSNPDTDAAIIIADLIILRQSEKEKTRNSLNTDPGSIDENEKW